MARYDGRANLRQNQPGGMTSEIAREIGRKGGLASAAKRERRKALRAVLEECQRLRPTDAELTAALAETGLPETYQYAMAVAALEKAAHGDVEAMRYVRDTLGEKPTETYNLSMEAKPVQALDLSKYSDAELEQLADGLPEED